MNMAAKELNQYLTFKLEDEIYALDISIVREVLEYRTLTKLPQTPDYVCGVMNLRERAVPVVDLRLKFGMCGTERTVNTCIIITEVCHGSDSSEIGILVDMVQEVYEFESDQIEPPPKMGVKLKTDFIKGMGKRDEAFIIILEVDKLFSMYDVKMVQLKDGSPLKEDLDGDYDSVNDKVNKEVLEKISSIEERIIRIEERLSLLEKGEVFPALKTTPPEAGEMNERKKEILRELIKENILLKKVKGVVSGEQAEGLRVSGS